MRWAGKAALEAAESLRRSAWRAFGRRVAGIQGVDTLRTLRDLESWSLRYTFARFVVERRLGLPYRGLLAPSEAGAFVRRDGYWFEPRAGTADRAVLWPFDEVQTRRFLRNRLGRAPRGGVFVDVGAHCGSFSILFERFFDRVLAVEPLPDNCRAMKHNLELNGLEQKITLFEAAAGEAEALGTLFIHGDALSSLLPDRDASRPMSVQIRALDDLLRDAAVSAESVRLLKVDVEGAEPRVLAGACRLLAAASPLVVLEANTPDAAATLEKSMKEMGYELVRVADRRNFCFERIAARLAAR
jgi:FkbM family methyltransferase